MSMKAIRRQLIAAVAMVLVAAIALGSSTFAWFASNSQVTAQNMQVKAVAEKGIVIAPVTKTGWATTANTTSTVASLVPTSTSASATPAWAHASSTEADNAQAGQVVGNYENLTFQWSDTANACNIGYVESNENTTYDAGTDPAYVQLNKFYIKSSGDTITGTAGEVLYINDVSVTGATTKIDNSVRVLVVVGGTAYIYAPVKDVDGGTTTMTYKFKNTTDVTALDASAAAGYDKATDIASIPNTDAGAVLACVYVYYEGEDANCKSTNISGVDVATLNVTVTFGTQPTHTP